MAESAVQLGERDDDSAASHRISADPQVLDWANLALPDAWTDRFRVWRWDEWRRMLRPIFGRPRRADIPRDLPGVERLPKYLVQEFHGIPNGNFSKRITRGYITAFDRTMLGSLTRARRRNAELLKDCAAVLDVGCGGGQMCGQLCAAGVSDVWGVDSSPYMLQHAARAYPGAKFAHSLAERLDFPDRRFDGVSVCFVLHELPPKVARQALREIHRVLRPGGKLAICEPSDEQMRLSLLTLTRRFGLRGLYFGVFARRVFEPFVMAWHRLSATNVLSESGFDVVTDQRQMPIRFIYAVKR